MTPDRTNITMALPISVEKTLNQLASASIGASRTQVVIIAILYLNDQISTGALDLEAVHKLRISALARAGA